MRPGNECMACRKWNRETCLDRLCWFCIKKFLHWASSDLRYSQLRYVTGTQYLDLEHPETRILLDEWLETRPT